MAFSPNRVAIDKLKEILDDGQPREQSYLIAHIEALIPTSEAVRDYLHYAKRSTQCGLNVDESDPMIPYRARHWRSMSLLRNLALSKDYERVGTKVRKSPKSEITAQHARSTQ